MPLTLMLLRHAKAKRDSADGKDHSRTLSRRGRAASDAMAKALRAEKLAPDRALVSSALRTRETWDRIAEAHGWADRERRDDRLYLAEAGRILRILRAEPDGEKTLMVVGHNPGLADLAGALAGSGDPEALAALRGRFPTGALAVIEFDAAHWRDIARDNGRLVRYLEPRELD
jgi:phosphohistidine phosphatase